MSGTLQQHLTPYGLDLASEDSAEEDRVLLTLIQSRDTGALERLLHKHVGRVQILIYRTIEGCGTWEDVEELAQDVFTQVWYQADKHDPLRGSVKKWINTFAKYAALDFRRKASRRNRIFQTFQRMQRQLSEDPMTQAFARMEDEQQLLVLREALKELPDLKVQFIIWRFKDEKTYREIAELADCPVGTAKARVSRALRELKRLIYLNS